MSGLSSHQLREWCGRRGVVLPDQPAAGRGRHALYSWQTILCLRILKQVHDEFGIEVGAWAKAIARCNDLLRHRPFPSLWGNSIVFDGTDGATLSSDPRVQTDKTALYVPLDPHLRELAEAFALPEMTQLPLFAAVAVRR
jgi:hypothetical protein